MTANEYLAQYTGVKRGGMRELAPRMICADGFDMSVQVSKYHYCTPRTDTGPYSKVEVGFPSAPVPEFAPYQDGDDDVYGYVPVEIVNAVIVAHGGIKERTDD